MAATAAAAAAAMPPLPQLVVETEPPANTTSTARSDVVRSTEIGSGVRNKGGGVEDAPEEGANTVGDPARVPNRMTWASKEAAEKEQSISFGGLSNRLMSYEQR